MPLNRIDSYQPTVQVAAARQQQVAPPRTAFADILSTGGQVLLAGASLTAGIVGGPVLAMAVSSAGSSLGRRASSGAVPGASAVGIEPPPPASTGPAAGGPAAAAPAAPGAASSSSPAGSVPPAGEAGSDVAAMRAMNQENFHMNSQLMQLQEEVQSENRRFSTLSNVLRARHDTAKAAVSNIRS